MTTEEKIIKNKLGVRPSNRWVTGNKRGKLRLRDRNDTVLSGI